MDLSLANVFTVSVLAAQAGAGAYNTSNLAIFTRESIANSFGTLGYKIYLDPSDGSKDFGSTSDTFAMMNAVFSQQPNILAGGGYLVVLPYLSQVQTITFSGVAASGHFVLNYGGHATAQIQWNDTATTIQADLQAVAGLSQVTVTGSIASQSLVVTMKNVSGDPALLTVTSDTLLTGGAVAITVTPAITTVSETLDAAISRTQGLVQYFGILTAEITTQAHMLLAAAVVQPLIKLVGFMSQTAADVAPGGMLDLLRTGSYSQSRGLFYGSQAIIAVQNVAFSSVPASGNWKLVYGSAGDTGSLNFNDSAATIQVALRTITGLSSVAVTGNYTSGFVVTFTGVDGPATLLTVSSNTLQNSTPAAVAITVTDVTVGLSIASARTECLVMAASYMGRGLSVNFSGSLTTITMHLKDLIGVQPDPSMTQTLLTQAQAAGADVYVSLQGVAKTFTSGANQYFDQVYNRLSYAGALQIAGFNALAQVGTKIPQTEDAMTGLKKVDRGICEQYVTNGYLAPGSWTSATTFGNQADFLRNVSERGYYIFSVPIALQNPVDRAARKAPLVQIAAKEAGAVHSGSIIVNINA